MHVLRHTYIYTVQTGTNANPSALTRDRVTVVRMTTLSGAEQPSLTWVYRNVRLIYRSGSLLATSDPLNNGVYTAVFYYSHNFVASTATIINVPLSRHNNSIQCSAPFGTPDLKTIRIAGIVIS